LNERFNASSYPSNFFLTLALKRSSFRLFNKIGVTKDYEKSELILDAMLELDAHNWVTLDIVPHLTYTRLIAGF
jgi:hypothetical protein